MSLYPYTMSWELYGDVKFNIMLETDIFKRFSQKKLGCHEGCFLRVWVSKKTPRHPTGYKTMAGPFNPLMLCTALALTTYLSMQWHLNVWSPISMFEIMDLGVWPCPMCISFCPLMGEILANFETYLAFTLHTFSLGFKENDFAYFEWNSKSMAVYFLTY